MSKKEALHPGKMLIKMLDERGINQSILALRLHCLPKKINEICNEKRGISADLALQLATAFSTKPDLWLDAQRDFELAEAIKKQKKKPKIVPLPLMPLDEKEILRREDELREQWRKRGSGLEKEPCGRCEKQVSPEQMVWMEMDNRDNTFTEEEDLEEEDSQGWFPLHKSCASLARWERSSIAR